MRRPAPPSYEELCRTFRWHIADRLNFAVEAIDRQASAGADGHRTALVAEAGAGIVARYTFLDLVRYSNRLAQVLAGRGIAPGMRVGLVMAPSGAAAVALLGVLKAGAVAVPLPVDAGRADPVERLAALDLSALIGDQHSAGAIEGAARRLPGLRLAMAAHVPGEALVEMWTSLIGADDSFAPVLTDADAPALLIDDVPGGPALYSHRALRARVAGAEYVFQRFPQTGDLMWSVSDWATDGGWTDAVLPSWFHGVPVAAAAPDAADQSGFPARCGVRVVHLPAGRLAVLQSALGRSRMPLRCLVATGALSPTDAGWLAKRFGPAFIPAFASPLLGPVASPAPGLGFATPQGALGRPVPGYGLDVVDDAGHILPAGEIGRLALPADSPLWPALAQEPAPLAGRWRGLGAKGRKDLDGLFWPDPPLAPPIPPPPAPPLRLGAPDPNDRWQR